MFNVYDKNKPASYIGYPVLNRLDMYKTHSFHSFAEALEYVNLHWHGGELPANWDGKPFDVSNGRGRMIEIREEP